MERYGAAAMWDDKAQVWKILEDLWLFDELHERRRVGVQLV
jgi:hypothetical protein